MKLISFPSCALALLLAWAAAPAQAKPGDTRIATWQDDRTGVFLLMFDDGWPGQWQVAVPELNKRGMIATFYVNPGKAEFYKFPERWAEVVRSGQVLANHTMTHRGAATPEAAVKEIEDCQAALYRLMPGKQPRLISFGFPGVKEWKLTADRQREVLARNHLIERPPFQGHGAVYHLQTAEQMLALADRAIRGNGMEYLIVHGVQRISPESKHQDFWPLSQAVFLALLDGLKQRRDRGDLWITDHVTWHKYREERQAATVKLLEAGGGRIRLELSATTDPAFYDTPLTLVTEVPGSWQRVTVSQGGSRVAVPTAHGRVRYGALPDAGPVSLTPAR